MINSFRFLLLATLATAAYFVYFTGDNNNANVFRSKRSPVAGVEASTGMPSNCRGGGDSVSSATVALTFDGGPHKSFTPPILSTLASANIKATFHVAADVLADTTAQTILRNIAASGHLVGQRWPQSVDLTSVTDADFKTQLVTDSQMIYGYASVWPKSLRFPFGTASANQIAMARSLGYIPVFFDIDSQDYLSSATTSSIVGRFLSVFQLEAGLPLLGSHIAIATDLDQAMVDALPSVITNITNSGYKIVSLSECVGLTSDYRSVSDNAGITGTTATTSAVKNDSYVVKASLLAIASLAFFVCML